MAGAQQQQCMASECGQCHVVSVRRKLNTRLATVVVIVIVGPHIPVCKRGPFLHVSHVAWSVHVCLACCVEMSGSVEMSFAGRFLLSPGILYEMGD